MWSVLLPTKFCLLRILSDIVRGIHYPDTMWYHVGRKYYIPQIDVLLFWNFVDCPLTSTCWFYFKVDTDILNFLSSALLYDPLQASFFFSQTILKKFNRNIKTQSVKCSKSSKMENSCSKNLVFKLMKLFDFLTAWHRYTCLIKSMIIHG